MPILVNINTRTHASYYLLYRQIDIVLKKKNIWSLSLFHLNPNMDQLEPRTLFEEKKKQVYGGV